MIYMLTAAALAFVGAAVFDSGALAAVGAFITFLLVAAVFDDMD